MSNYWYWLACERCQAVVQSGEMCCNCGMFLCYGCCTKAQAERGDCPRCAAKQEAKVKASEREAKERKKIFDSLDRDVTLTFDHVFEFLGRSFEETQQLLDLLRPYLRQQALFDWPVDDEEQIVTVGQLRLALRMDQLLLENESLKKQVINQETVGRLEKENAELKETCRTFQEEMRAAQAHAQELTTLVRTRTTNRDLLADQLEVAKKCLGNVALATQDWIEHADQPRTP